MPTTSPFKQRNEKLRPQSVMLKPSQVRALQRVAQEQDRTLSNLMRQAVDQFLSADRSKK